MYIDTHTHLDRYSSEKNDQMLDQIESDRILSLSVSTDPDSFRKNKTLSRQSDFILCSFGIHPWDAADYSDRLENLDQYINQSRTLGEIGLDKRFVKDSSSYSEQKTVFEYQLKKAYEQQKPVNLHTSGAEGEILEYLQEYPVPSALIHWYKGPLDLIPAYLDQGCYFSIGVEILFSESYRKVANAIPIDHLLTETDNPTASPWLKGIENRRKHPGMPRLIKRVVKELAGIHGMSVPDLNHRIYKNFLAFYPGSDRIPSFR